MKFTAERKAAALAMRDRGDMSMAPRARRRTTTLFDHLDLPPLDGIPREQVDAERGDSRVMSGKRAGKKVPEVRGDGTNPRAERRTCQLSALAGRFPGRGQARSTYRRGSVLVVVRSGRVTVGTRRLLLGDCASPRVTPASRGRRLLSALVLQPNGLQLAICSALLLATSRSIAALVAQPSFPNGTGILGRLSLLDRAESGSLAEGAASATTQKPTLGAADFRFDRIISCKALMI